MRDAAGGSLPGSDVESATLRAAPFREHLPIRRSWLCASCGEPWPCVSRRMQLAGEYAGASVSLALLMAAALTEAMRDLPMVPAGELHARFLGWMHCV